MKYMLFAGDTFYGSGGMNDFKGLFQEPDDAFNYYTQHDWDWCQIVNATSLQVIEYYGEVYSCGTPKYNRR